MLVPPWASQRRLQQVRVGVVPDDEGDAVRRGERAGQAGEKEQEQAFHEITERMDHLLRPIVGVLWMIVQSV